MDKTFRLKQDEIKRNWHLIDAKDKVLGRLAVQISHILQGKIKSSYSRDVDCGDFVVVVNAKEVKTTGNKAQQLVYFHHSGYPRGDKYEQYQEMLKSKPEQIIFSAVSGMLPKNKLRAKYLKRLKVFSGSSHNLGAQININQIQ